MTHLGRLLLATSLVLSTACGGDDSSDGATDALPIDSAGPDSGSGTPDSGSGSPDAAPAARVVEVTCPATPAASVTTTGGAGPSAVFSPASVTINVNDVVKFTTPATHTVAPNAPTTDAGLNVGTSQTKCLQFTAADTFHYMCGIHNVMKGTVTVN